MLFLFSLNLRTGLNSVGVRSLFISRTRSLTRRVSYIRLLCGPLGPHFRIRCVFLDCVFLIASDLCTQGAPVGHILPDPPLGNLIVQEQCWRCFRPENALAAFSGGGSDLSPIFFTKQETQKKRSVESFEN